MCLVHQLAIKCKSILHGGNIQEEITEADICGLHIYEFVVSFFSTVKITRAGLAKFATDIISLSYLFSAAERTNEIIVGTDQLMEI